MRFHFALLVTFVIAVFPLHAQAPVDSHLSLATVITDEAHNELNFETTMRVGFEGVLRADPEMLVLDAECPGLIDMMTESVRPIMWELHQRDNLAYRAALHKLFATEMSAADAADGTVFLSSPLGQRFIVTLNGGISADNIVSDALATDGESISKDAVEKDLVTSAVRGIAAMSADDRLELIRVFNTQSWAKAFSAMQPKVVALQVAMANQDYSPEDNARIEAVLEKSSIAHFAECYAQ